MSRRLSFAILLLALAGQASAADRPNVLWLIAEDFGPHLGCYGTPEARTPNLDGLAAKGIRFTHAFSTAPVCSASRSAFMTGMYQTTIGAHHHRSHRDDGYRLPEGVRTLPDRLREAGYFTANVVHLTDDKAEKFYRGTGKTDWNFTVEGKPFESDRWDDLKAHQPFYAQVNFSETHRGPAWNTAKQHLETPADPGKVEIPPYYPDHPLVREDWAEYLNSAMALDKKVGFILKKLEEDGLADDTVVIFFGDHGQAMPRGKQWCYDSGLGIPLIMYWPEGVAAPQGYEPGGVTDRLVESIDLTATTLAAAGIPKPEVMQGQVLFGENADPPRDAAFGARDRCDETTFRIRTVRTSRYRYIRNFDHEKPFLLLNRYKETSYPTIPLIRSLYAEEKLDPVQARLASPEPRPAEELYDLESDPHEIHNLAESAGHRDMLVGLRQKLDRWIEETDDRGRTPEPEQIVRDWIAKQRKNDDAKFARVKEQWPKAYPLDERFLIETWLGKESRPAEEKPGFDPTSRYERRTLEGWPILVSDRFAGEDPKLLDDVLAEMRKQLVAIVETVPAPAVEQIRKIPIWVEVNDPLFPCMCYHPDERWLKAHGVNPEKTGAVELANARNFLSWTRQQPWMILHELAHGYHDRFVENGYENTIIAKALESSKSAGRYGEVDHVAGSKRDHYAATNPMEFFAEGTESYFGKNDFFPFERTELQKYDPELLSLLEELWQVRGATVRTAD